MNAPNEGSPHRRIASETTPPPTSQSTSEIPRDVAERAVTAALVHWDELERSSLEALAGNDSMDRAKLDLLRSAETWLRGPHGPEELKMPSVGREGAIGTRRSHAPLGPHPSPEDLYDFGRGPGASPLQLERRTEIEAHLAECAICDRAAASLVTTPPVPLLVDKPGVDLSKRIEALPEVDRALLARICGTKRDDQPVTGAPTPSGPPLTRLSVPTKLEEVRHTPAPAAADLSLSAATAGEGASFPPQAGKSAPSSQDGSPIAEDASPRGPQLVRDPLLSKDSEREAPTATSTEIPSGTPAEAPAARFQLLRGSARSWQRSAGAAAAALLLGVVGISFFQSGDASADPASLREIATMEMGYPEISKRGETEIGLAHPRGRVLYRDPSSSLPQWAEPFSFELSSAVQGAEGYRFDLYHSVNDNAFEAGEQLATIESLQPRATLDASTAAKLEPGSYTWEAWVNINGLDQSLGELDFRIVESKATWLTLNEAEKTARTVKWLHEQGFESDARSRARALEPSASRDTYLRDSSAPVR